MKQNDFEKKTVFLKRPSWACIAFMFLKIVFCLDDSCWAYSSSLSCFPVPICRYLMRSLQLIYISSWHRFCFTFSISLCYLCSWHLDTFLLLEWEHVAIDSCGGTASCSSLYLSFQYIAFQYFFSDLDIMRWLPGLWDSVYLCFVY